MARHWDKTTNDIYRAAAEFRDKCLQRDGSLLSDDASVWTTANLTRLHQVFNKNRDDGKRSFFEKYKDQLTQGGPEIIRLGAEALAVYYLFPDNVGGPRKREGMNTVLGWANESLPEGHLLSRAFSSGIGSGGQGYNTRRPFEVGFLVDFALAWKQLNLPERDAILRDPWRFQSIIDQVEDAEGRQIRHMLLHLLFPEQFERIASRSHKRRVLDAFGTLATDDSGDEDRQLLSIRNELSKLLPGRKLDFYEAPLASAWYDDGEGDEDLAPIDLIQYKKAVILYGPPGTSKTFRAKQTANRIIHAAALRKLGPARYFQSQSSVDETTRARVHRLQLHPAYSYEEFVCGIQIKADGSTGHQLGFLPRLVQEMDREPASDRLPHVLVLDEINRSDLSRLLGPAFSLLEDRDETIPLSARDERGAPIQLKIPNDLYFIGTMNLIDQSVEQIDFALRRRFLWLLCPFDRETLKKASKHHWNTLQVNLPWERVEDDFARLADAAAALNKAIHESDLLGPQYEVGHTYFFTVAAFLKDDLGPKPSSRKYFLWDAYKPRAPIQRVWDLSLKPLLQEYLSGLETKTREAELAKLRGVFFARPDPEQ